MTLKIKITPTNTLWAHLAHALEIAEHLDQDNKLAALTRDSHGPMIESLEERLKLAEGALNRLKTAIDWEVIDTSTEPQE